MTPRSFRELLADSFLLIKESSREGAAIAALGRLPGLTASSAVFLSLGLVDMPTLRSAIIKDDPSVVWPLLAVGLLDKFCGAWSLIALVRALSAREEGKALSVVNAYRESLRLIIPYALTQLRALLNILWGLIRLIWPGLKLCVLYCFVPMAVIVEGLRGSQALERSAAIMEIDLRRALGNLLAAAVLASVAYALLSIAVTAVMTLPQNAMRPAESIPEALLMGLVNQMVNVLVMAWLAAFSMLLYRDLRMRPKP